MRPYSVTLGGVPSWHHGSLESVRRLFCHLCFYKANTFQTAHAWCQSPVTMCNHPQLKQKACFSNLEQNLSPGVKPIVLCCAFEGHTFWTKIQHIECTHSQNMHLLLQACRLQYMKVTHYWFRSALQVFRLCNNTERFSRILNLKDSRLYWKKILSQSRKNFD